MSVALVACWVLVPWTRILLVAPLLLYLPGLLIGGGLFARHQIFSAELTVIAMGISFAMAVSGGLLLGVSPWGLGPASWAFYYAAVLVVGAAAWRRGRGAWLPAPSAIDRPRSTTGPPRRGLLLAVASALAVGAFAIALVSSALDREAFTELSVAPGGNDGGSNVAVLRITATSHEPKALRYSLILTSRGVVLDRFPDIRLDPGGTWQGTSTFRNLSATTIIDVRLYLADAQPAQAYRSVSVTVAWAQGQP